MNSAACMKSIVQDFKEKITLFFVTQKLVGQGTVTEHLLLYEVVPTSGVSLAGTGVCGGLEVLVNARECVHLHTQLRTRESPLLHSAVDTSWTWQVIGTCLRKVTGPSKLRRQRSVF